MKVKETIILLLKQTSRPGIEDLIEWMEENGFFDSPCSSHYHLAQPGGLAEHSLNVYRSAISLAEAFFVRHEKKLTFEMVNSIAICALLHDLGKAGQFGKPAYIKNEEEAEHPYRVNKDLLYMPHEVRSIAIASRFIQLTEEEQFAICYHNGLYGEMKSVKGKETELYMVLHFSDMWASRVVEKE